MSTATSVTEPLRAEHRELRPHLQLATVAASLSTWDATTPGRLRAAVEFLRDHLVPHARAEEAVLYPAVEAAMGAPGATATMVADHLEVVRRITALEEAVADVGPEAPPAALVEDLRKALYGLDAVLSLHFAKEEDVLLPVLDAHLNPTEAEQLFAAMGSTAHGEHR